MQIDTPDLLFKSRNLLGFSAGVDSTALFFSLIDKNIEFDIAIVDYGLREQSKEEVKYAQELAEKHNKRCFVLRSSKKNLISNIEAKAREVRYDFFSSIIQKEGYDNLILAHQLNDKMEWCLMKMAQGCGINTMSGFELVNRDRDYTIVRPLIMISRNEIDAYLKSIGLKFFIDESNLENNYTRNKFRNNFVNDYITEHAAGVKETFKLLSEEKNILYPEIIFKNVDHNMFYIANVTGFQDHQKMCAIDKCLKNKFGYLMSKHQRDILLKAEFNALVNEVAVETFRFENKKYVCVFKNIEAVMTHKEKESFRIHRIPPRLRQHIKGSGLSLTWFMEKMHQF